jgi:hypothetical protein
MIACAWAQIADFIIFVARPAISRVQMHHDTCFFERNYKFSIPKPRLF